MPLWLMRWSFLFHIFNIFVLVVVQAVKTPTTKEGELKFRFSSWSIFLAVLIGLVGDSLNVLL